MVGGVPMNMGGMQVSMAMLPGPGTDQYASYGNSVEVHRGAASGSMGMPSGPANERARMGPGPSDDRGMLEQEEFARAITFVNKVKNKFTGDPTLYKSFLELLQRHHSEGKEVISFFFDHFFFLFRSFSCKKIW